MENSKILLKLLTISGDPGFSHKHCQLDIRCLRACFSNYLKKKLSSFFSAQIPLVLMGDERLINSFLKSWRTTKQILILGYRVSYQLLLASKACDTLAGQSVCDKGAPHFGVFKLANWWEILKFWCPIGWLFPVQNSVECLCVTCNCMCQSVVMDKMYVNMNCLLITSIIREIIILTLKNIYSRWPMLFSPSVLYSFIVFPLEW